MQTFYQRNSSGKGGAKHHPLSETGANHTHFRPSVGSRTHGPLAEDADPNPHAVNEPNFNPIEYQEVQNEAHSQGRDLPVTKQELDEAVKEAQRHYDDQK